MLRRKQSSQYSDRYWTSKPEALLAFMKARIIAILISMSVAAELCSQTYAPVNYHFSYEIEQMLATDKLRLPAASYYYTFIGDYHRAIATYDIPISWGTDTLQVGSYGTDVALSRIIEEAKDKRLVIISESHLKPQHRIFARAIIDSLAMHGFHCLGIEALSPSTGHPTQLLDTALNQRGYASPSLSGFYTQEPQMAELIRSAIKNGYTLFGYESDQSIPDKDRDEIQADNVIRFLRTHDADKVILLCGWHHVIESNEIKRRDAFWMTRYLKDKLGLDPLTIYQDNFTEKVVYNTHPFLDTESIKTPLVFTPDDTIARLSQHVDIEVIHPKTKYVHGRPHWLFQDVSYKEYALDKEWVDIEYPFFFMAFNPGEESDGTPVDIIEIKEKFDQRSLILKPGNYIIRIDNKVKGKERLITVIN